MLNRFAAVALVILLVATLLAGVIKLFQMRLGTGDVYPPYSSLRSDPLGTKALYRSLGALEGIEVQKNIEGPEKLTSGKDSTLLILGLPSSEVLRASRAEVRILE